MRQRYRLQELGNNDLLAALSALVRRGNEVTSDLLAHLAEVDERQLHLKLGFPSLFAYCTEALGFCESAAGRRIAAARVCRRFPEAFAQVAKGELHLSALCALSGHLTLENAAALFAACARKSRRQVDEALAARFPKSDVREQIRRLPVQLPALVRGHSAERLSGEAAAVVDAQVRAQVTRHAEASEEPGSPSERARGPISDVGALLRPVEPLSMDRYGFHFTGSARLKEKVERARALASHQLPSGELAALVELAFDRLLSDLEKRRFAAGRRVRRGALATPPPPGGCAPAQSEPRSSDGAAAGPRAGATSSGVKRSRYVPAAVAREVYARDRARCSFVSEGGRCCASRAFLELDHVIPWAVGGMPTVDNLRVRCRAHNQQHAREHFGEAHVEARITRDRRDRDTRGPERHDPRGARAP